MTRQNVAVALPAALLVTIACCQIALTRTSSLSPWKGGGFGMFASLDGMGFRSVRLFVEAPSRSEELAVPDSLAGDAMKVAALPTERALRSFAGRVLERERQRQRPADSVRVEVWRTSFSPTLESTSTRLSTLTREADAHLAGTIR